MKKEKTASVRIDHEVLRVMRTAAAKEGRTLKVQIERILVAHIENGKIRP